MMDFFAHIFLSLIVFWDSPDILWAVLFGFLPDLPSFLPIFLLRLRKGWPRGPPKITTPVEKFFVQFYYPTHSLLVASIIIALSCIVAGSLWIPLLAWPLHILVDIPTHSKKNFATPIFWPISRWTFNGWPWGSKRMMIIIYASLAVLALLRVLITLFV